MLLDGKKLAAEKEALLGRLLQDGRAQGLPEPKLAIILANDLPASSLYVSNKLKKCASLGCQSLLIKFGPDSTTEQLLGTLDSLNRDPSVHGILCQLPLFPHLDTKQVLRRIDPQKDVDGLHPENIGLMNMEIPRFLPCTPQGILWLLDAYHYKTSGKHAVIIGRSPIVGRPMATLLSTTKRNMTVSLLHSFSHDVEDFLQQADLIVLALGKAHFIKDQALKKSAWLIDVGINSNPDTQAVQKTVGDADFKTLEHRIEAISPVPFGVGPMTIISMLTNLAKAAGYQPSWVSL